MALNKVMLIGNVGADPEVRYLDQNNPQNPSKVATFRLATSERYRDRNTNELRELTEWHNIVAWGRNADVVEKYVKKGTGLFVEGSLRNRSYDDRNGQKRYITEIRAENLQLLGRAQDNPAMAGNQAAGTPAQTQQPPQTTQAPQQPATPMPVEDDDDLPF